MEIIDSFNEKVSTMQKLSDEQKRSFNKAYVTYSGIALDRIYRAALQIAKEEFTCNDASSFHRLPVMNK